MARPRRALRILLLLAALLVALPALLPANAHAASPAEYRRALADALATVEGASDDERAGALTRVAAALAAVGEVDLGAGRTLRVVNPPLGAALADGDSDRVRAHLAATLDALDAAAALPAPPPNATTRLADVLARAEFRTPEPNALLRLLAPLLGFVQPLVDRVQEIADRVRLAGERFWRGVLAWLDDRIGAGQGWLWVGLGVLVVLGVAAVVAGAFAGNVVSGARVAAPRAGGRASASASRERALALAQAGEYRAAIHERYLATLLALDERRLLRYRPDLTNREHLTTGRLSPALRPALAPLVEAFDALWYSGAAVGTDEWARFAALAGAVDAIPAANGSPAEHGRGTPQPEASAT